MKFELEQTCAACPEQYDVFRGARQVGYIRLRSGYLYLSYPDVYGDTVYEHTFEDRLKGCFDSEEERDIYLKKCLEALKNKIISEMIDGDMFDVEYTIK